MPEKTIFISYPFTDDDAKEVIEVVQEIATRLQRVTIVDGRSLDLRRNFSGEISDFIRAKADCLVAVLLEPDESVSNVIFEVGIAVGAGKDVILITESAERLPAMLRSYDAVVLDRGSLKSGEEFGSRLEKKLRNYLLVPSDHVVEEKIRRRYLDEEINRLKDYSQVRAAIEIIRAGDLTQARAVLENLLDREPQNVDAHYLLSDTLYLIGCSRDNPLDRDALFELQHEFALKALEIDPRSVLAMNVKANAEVRLGKLREARSTLETAKDMDSDYSLPFYNSACLYGILGERASALADLKEAITRNEIWKQQAKGDPDFVSLRADREWRDIVYDLRRGGLSS